MLCSLVCAQREQTLCLLDLNHKVFLPNAIKFVISDRHKTSRQGKMLEVYFPSLPSKVNLCPKSTLEEYLSRTEPLRNLNGLYSSKVSLLQLNVAFRHDPIKCCVISVISPTALHWLRCFEIA
jgi:hypothetical protein